MDQFERVGKQPDAKKQFLEKIARQREARANEKNISFKSVDEQVQSWKARLVAVVKEFACRKDVEVSAKVWELGSVLSESDLPRDDLKRHLPVIIKMCQQLPDLSTGPPLLGAFVALHKCLCEHEPGETSNMLSFSKTNLLELGLRQAPLTTGNGVRLVGMFRSSLLRSVELDRATEWKHFEAFCDRVKGASTIDQAAIYRASGKAFISIPALCSRVWHLHAFRTYIANVFKHLCEEDIMNLSTMPHESFGSHEAHSVVWALGNLVDLLAQKILVNAPGMPDLADLIRHACLLFGVFFGLCPLCNFQDMHPCVREVIFRMQEAASIQSLLNAVCPVKDSVLHYNSFLLVQYLLPADRDEASERIRELFKCANFANVSSAYSTGHGQAVLPQVRMHRPPRYDSCKLITFHHLAALAEAGAVKGTSVDFSTALNHAVQASHAACSMLEVFANGPSTVQTAPRAVRDLAPPALDPPALDDSEVSKLQQEGIDLVKRLQEVQERTEASLAETLDKVQIGDNVFYVGTGFNIEFGLCGSVISSEPCEYLEVRFEDRKETINVLKSDLSCKRPDFSHHGYTLYHGCSMTSAKKIQAKGFQESQRGELGPGIYLVGVGNVGKAKRFAHDEFHRAKCSKFQTPEPEPALIKCYVRTEKVFHANGSCSDGSWQQNGFSACWAPKTGVSNSSEWCIRDGKKIEILEIIDLRGDGCPWRGQCPYEARMRSKSGTPWGGCCPCKLKSRCAKRGIS